METLTVTPSELLNVVNELKNNGKFFVVNFNKVNGSIRQFVCRFGVKAFLKGNGPATTVNKKEYVVVYSLKDGYRNVSLNRVNFIACQGKKYVLF